MQQAPVYSRTPMWVIPLAIVSLLLVLLLALALRATVWGPWPVCPMCERRRLQRRQVMWWCLAGAVLSVVAAIALSYGPVLLLVIPLGIAALVYRDLGEWRWVTASEVERSTRSVHVKAPAAAFVAALPAPRRAPDQFATFPPQRGW